MVVQQKRPRGRQVEDSLMNVKRNRPLSKNEADRGVLSSSRQTGNMKSTQRYMRQTANKELRKRNRLLEQQGILANDRKKQRGKPSTEKRSHQPVSNVKSQPINKKNRSRSGPIPKKTSSRKFLSIVMNILFYFVTIGIISVSIIFAANRRDDGSIFGYHWYTVLTNSMVPQKDSPKGGFYAGDLIFVKNTSFQDLNVGDVVTYQLSDGGHQLTHRLVDKLTNLNGEDGEYIITKGDANSTEDNPVPSQRIIGKVTFVVPKAGEIMTFLKNHIFLIVLIVSCLWMITWIYRKRRWKKFASREGERKVGTKSKSQTTKNRRPQRVPSSNRHR